jgi:hypothetical protein
MPLPLKMDNLSLPQPESFAEVKTVMDPSVDSFAEVKMVLASL